MSIEELFVAGDDEEFEEAKKVRSRTTSPSRKT
jgi:hypothetical protein